MAHQVCSNQNVTNAGEVCGRRHTHTELKKKKVVALVVVRFMICCWWILFKVVLFSDGGKTFALGCEKIRCCYACGVCVCACIEQGGITPCGWGIIGAW